MGDLQPSSVRPTARARRVQGAARPHLALAAEGEVPRRLIDSDGATGYCALPEFYSNNHGFVRGRRCPFTGPTPHALIQIDRWLRDQEISPSWLGRAAPEPDTQPRHRGNKERARSLFRRGRCTDAIITGPRHAPPRYASAGQPQPETGRKATGASPPRGALREKKKCCDRHFARRIPSLFDRLSLSPSWGPGVARRSGGTDGTGISAFPPPAGTAEKNDLLLVCVIEAIWKAELQNLPAVHLSFSKNLSSLALCRGLQKTLRAAPCHAAVRLGRSGHFSAPFLHALSDD